MAGVYYNQGKYKEALDLFRKALNIRKAKLGDEHPDTKQVQEWVAEMEAKV